MELIAELVSYGLIHGDFNEFNLLLLTLATAMFPSLHVYPQLSLSISPKMVSIDHENAESYFNRDVECIRTFFAKQLFQWRWNFSKQKWDVKRNEEHKLDVELKASGYIKPKREKKRENINDHSDKDTNSDVSSLEDSEELWFWLLNE